MQKKFYVSKTPEQGGMAAPEMDRFRRIEKLNALLAVGWEIKGFEETSEGSCFLLEKQ